MSFSVKRGVAAIQKGGGSNPAMRVLNGVGMGGGPTGGAGSRGREAGEGWGCGAQVGAQLPEEVLPGGL